MMSLSASEYHAVCVTCMPWSREKWSSRSCGRLFGKMKKVRMGLTHPVRIALDRRFRHSRRTPMSDGIESAAR